MRSDQGSTEPKARGEKISVKKKSLYGVLAIFTRGRILKSEKPAETAAKEAGYGNRSGLPLLFWFLLINRRIVVPVVPLVVSAFVLQVNTVNDNAQAAGTDVRK